MSKVAGDILSLSGNSDDPVMLTTVDEDRFMRSQREIVASMRGAEDILAEGKRVTDEFNAMISDIKAWCKLRAQVREVHMCPRAEDLLAVVVAADEDPKGELDDAISSLDLEMFSRNKFRVSWLMLRASEAHGLESFGRSPDMRCVYRARP